MLYFEALPTSPKERLRETFKSPLLRRGFVQRTPFGGRG